MDLVERIKEILKQEKIKVIEITEHDGIFRYPPGTAVDIHLSNNDTNTVSKYPINKNSKKDYIKPILTKIPPNYPVF